MGGGENLLLASSSARKPLELVLSARSVSGDHVGAVGEVVGVSLFDWILPPLSGVLLLLLELSRPEVYKIHRLPLEAVVSFSPHRRCCDGVITRVILMQSWAVCRVFDVEVLTDLFLEVLDEC